jgi:ubiquinone/menaquinone biosynthesis C-methylase UbiE
MSDFKDHFSGHSSNYQKYRPGYPKELFSYLNTLCEENKYAWDVGTGNGQCALALAAHFDAVLATDPSENQIRDAVRHDKIQYDVSPAEKCPEPDHSFDLITVAQALHWFDIDKFFNEVRRVVRPNGILAAWTYTHAVVSPEVDRIYSKFYTDIVGNYWPAERRYVEEKYQSIKFPFEDIESPQFKIQMEYSREDYLAYLGTWSAVKNYKLDKKHDPIDLIRSELSEIWSDSEELRVVTWPIHLKAGVVN